MGAEKTEIRSYKDLLVWKASLELAVGCYLATKSFPGAEIYGMTSQIRRASASIAANVAEGHGRENRGAFIQFLRIAQGSLKELETHLILSERVALLETETAADLLRKTDEIGRMLRSLIRTLQEKQ
ncbi:MAG TPA: four helix bundle protein [Pararhizobium sp.]|nr:four helix bundle protein [Pararhizobium sp.]